MEDDLDTTTAVKVMVELAQEVVQSVARDMKVDGAQVTLRQMSQVFGLRFGRKPEVRVEEGWGEHLGRFGG